MRRLLTKDLAAVGLLTLLVVTAFANVVFGGKSLLPSSNENPMDWRPTDQNYGPGFVPHEEWARRGLFVAVNYRDTAASALQLEPSREFFRRSLLRGEFPFWDPYVGGGTPSFSTLVPGYLFPPALAVVLFGNGSLVNNLYILLLMICAGALTYFLLRRHGLSWQGSIAGAIAFTFSGAIIQMTPSELGQPVAMFSLPLLVAARLIDRPCARRAAELALAFAFVALASFPPILVAVFGTSMVYLIVTIILRPRGERAKIAGWFVAGAVTSMAIVGLAYIPALPVMADSTHITEYYSTAGVSFLHPRLIMQLLSPTIAGGSAIYRDSPLLGPTGLHLFYTGVIPLLLSGIGFLAPAERRTRVLKLTAILVGALALAKIFGLPPVQWVIYLPLLRNIHYAAYFGIVVAFAIAILAALGVEALVRSRARRWQIAASGAVLAVALILLRISAARAGVHLHPEGWRWIADFRVLVLFAILGVGFAFVATRSMRAARIAIALVISILIVEGISNSVYPRQQRWNVWAHPPRYVELLADRNTGGRVLPMPNYPANTEQVFRQPTIDSLTLNTSPRIFDLYRRYFSPNIGNFLQSTRRIPPERILDIANIEYLAISTPDNSNLLEAQKRGYQTLFADELLYLERRPTAPRYFLTSDYQLAPSAQAALDALPALPAGAVVLEQQPSFASTSASNPQGRVTVARFSLNEVELVADTPAASILVCSESNMRGWTATVDGEPVPILAANYAFRGVEVPAGLHTIRLRYRPPGIYVGLMITVMGLMACFWGMLQPRVSPPAPEP